jgi:hypothetical protein
MKRVIVANKLPFDKSSTGRDVWYKTYVDVIDYTVDKVTNANGAEVSMGEAYTILFPFNNSYVPSQKWTDSDFLNRDNTFTMQTGDIIFFDDFPDAITSNSILELQDMYQSCEVRVVEEREQMYGVKEQLRVSGV